MLGLIKVFNRLFKRPEIQIPKAGEYWYIPDKSPWPPKDRFVKVLDVKDGWVRYYIGEFFPDERVTISTFLYIYKKYEE